MGSQFFTAVGAFVGTFLGIWIAETTGSGTADSALKVGEGFFGTSVGGGELVIPMTAGGESSVPGEACAMALTRVTFRLPLHCQRQCHPRAARRVAQRQAGAQGGTCSVLVVDLCNTMLTFSRSTPPWRSACFAW